jgi:sterol desaturase/sphingolipid hydroxylase (fatty acid hydroxylase superfamily)
MKGNIIFGLLVGALIFVPLERLFALRKEQKVFRQGWRSDVLHFLFTRTLSEACGFIVIGSLLLLLHWLVSPTFQAAVAAQPRLVQFLEAVLIANVGGYFGHRLSHEIPFLWRFHAVHHSSAQMDWLAAARVHPLDQIVTKSLTLVPLYLMGFSKATFGAYVGLATLHAVFIHANVKFKFGKLRWWLGTPEFHHWHHSNEPQAFNRNFAGELPLLDWIFGTIYLPDRLPTAYGTNEPVPTGYVGQMLFPFRRPSTS